MHTFYYIWNLCEKLSLQIHYCILDYLSMPIRFQIFLTDSILFTHVFTSLFIKSFITSALGQLQRIRQSSRTRETSLSDKAGWQIDNHNSEKEASPVPWNHRESNGL